MSEEKPRDDRFTEEMQLEFEDSEESSEEDDQSDVAKVKKDISDQLVGPDADILRKHL